jgi:hypothetical protein
VGAFEASGMTRKRFCEAQKIPITTLDYYRRAVSRSKGRTRLVRVKVQETPRTAHSGVSIRLGEQLRIELERDFDGEVLRQALSVLGRE